MTGYRPKQWWMIRKVVSNGPSRIDLYCDIGIVKGTPGEADWICEHYERDLGPDEKISYLAYPVEELSIKES
jgi:hypothetical protein